VSRKPEGEFAAGRPMPPGPLPPFVIPDLIEPGMVKLSVPKEQVVPIKAKTITANSPYTAGFFKIRLFVN
jgi:hypothetical protein